MPNKGEQIQQWVWDMMHQVAIDLKASIGTNRFPSAREIREQLEADFKERGEDPRAIPSLASIRSRTRDLKKRMPKVGGIDDPWSLGMSERFEIPDDASGALLAVWKFSLTFPLADPFTNRMARWVSKLRWVPEAGGSPIGEAEYPQHLYFCACLYAGRERQVELIRDKKDIRSGVLDAQIMLGHSAMLAKKLGLIEDDTGIDYGDEFSKVAPNFTMYSRMRQGLAAGQMADLQRNIKENTSKFDMHRFGPHADEANVRAEVEVRFNLALKVLVNDERFKKFTTTEQSSDCAKRLLDHLYGKFMAGEMRSWEPPIEALLAE